MYLLFGVHNHQPVGNFAEVFKKATRYCYQPFVNTLYRYPQIKATIHFSGSLIDWMLKDAPEVLAKIKEMVKRGQIEILSGGYYEPILPIIPERDRIGQINMLSSFIKDYFEYEPKGMWIGERVWEVGLVKSITETGVQYILLDDFHFLNAGIKQENLTGYYVIEEAGSRLAVFPINKVLRYSIPFSLPAQPIVYLKNLVHDREDIAITIVDDGEKFGLWPGTYRWVYGQKWLENFFQLLLRNNEWLKTQTVGDYMKKYKPLGSCHIPSASYEEMMQWSGGSFRNFFFKYPEANNLQQRMLYLSQKLKQSSKDNKEAKRYLYMAQCNCPYWHGVFGGIYLGHLRHAAYKNLLTTQALLDQQKHLPWIESEIFDFDKDGKDELVIKNSLLNIFIAPQLGGGIFELDYIAKTFNLMDTITRRSEPYYEKIIGKNKGRIFKSKRKPPISIHDLLSSKEPGLKNLLVFDKYRRISLLDHFLSKELAFSDFKNMCYEELGDFIDAHYSVKVIKESRTITVILQRTGTVRYNAKKVPLAISKKITLNDCDAKIIIEYSLENLSRVAIDIIFAIEFNISPENQALANKLQCQEKSKQRIFSLTEDVKIKSITDINLLDATKGIKTAFYFDKYPHLWSYPLETVSASEQGFERNYQQTVILPYWPLTIEKLWQLSFTIVIS
jgi:alpha-amylase